MEWVLIAVGGAIGSMCRYAVGMWVQRASHSGFPAGTLAVNVIGSIIVGLLTGWLMNAQTHPLIRPALVVGFCGGFTTFSSFGMETVGLMKGGEVSMAAAYVLTSLVLGIAGAALGFSVAMPKA
jgi:CrcB protein